MTHNKLKTLSILLLIIIVKFDVCSKEILMDGFLNKGRVDAQTLGKRGGKWDIADDKITVDSMVGEAFLFMGSDNWQNYQVDVDIRFIRVRDASRWCSVVFRGNSSGEMPWSQYPVRFLSSAKNGTEFAVKENNRWFVRATAPARKDSELNKTRQIKVIVSGSNVQGFLDGTHTISSDLCRDRSFGCIGLGLSGCIVEFESFIVTKLPDTPIEEDNVALHSRLIAHRGASGIAPENTLAAIKEALRLKSGAVEIDVRGTLNGLPVLIHDKTLDRTSGHSGKVQDYDLLELSKLDVGIWKNPSYKGEKIPTLDEALRRFVGTNVDIIIDLKENRLTQHVLTSIEKFELTEQAFVISSSPSQLKLIHALNSHIKTGLLISKFPPTLITNTKRCVWIQKELRNSNSKIADLNFKLLNKDLVSKLHNKGITVWAWTVNDPIVIRKLISSGVDLVTTDVVHLFGDNNEDSR